MGRNGNWDQLRGRLSLKISYDNFLKKTSLTKEELLAYTWGTLLEDPPVEGYSILPAPPLLMIDRVTEVIHDGNKGRIIGEQDIALDSWFFQCHFRQDPVQPGCLGVDAVWQLLGVYATLRGAKGVGRALGAKEIEFFGQIRPHNKKVCYEVDIRRYTQTALGTSFTIGSALVLVDGEPVYTIKEAKVGSFIGIDYKNYPHMATNAVGGAMNKVKEC